MPSHDYERDVYGLFLDCPRASGDAGDDGTKEHSLATSLKLEDSTMDLKGSVLIAMPGMADPRFASSVVYMCDHSDKGAMGLVVNKPAPDVDFLELLDQLEIEPSEQGSSIGVFIGGPVETGRGFVLHTSDYTSDLRTLAVSEDVALTPTLDVLEDIACGKGPAQAMMMLGYAGWGPGQLEAEIAHNGWLTTFGDPELLFAVRPSLKWQHALNQLGIDPVSLSAASGTA